LIANELLTNALKYAYSEPQAAPGCEIRIEVSEDRIVISDDGPGLPTDHDESAMTTLGLRLVRTLVRQLDAKLEINNDRGARFCLLLFPPGVEPNLVNPPIQ
jgi:two-component sensor histidine kinase